MMGRLRPPAWPPTNPYSGVVSDYVHSEADFRDLQVPRQLLAVVYESVTILDNINISVK